MKYDYYCSSNGKTVEVSHSMREELKTWGEVCVRANIDLGSTPQDTPVQRIITGGSGAIIKGEAQEPRCHSGEMCSTPNPGCCCGGHCSHK